MKSSTAYRKSTHSHAFSREHSTRMLKFKLESTLISSTIHVRWRKRVSRGLMMSAVDINGLSKFQKIWTY